MCLLVLVCENGYLDHLFLAARPYRNLGASYREMLDTHERMRRATNSAVFSLREDVVLTGTSPIIPSSRGLLIEPTADTSATSSIDYLFLPVSSLYTISSLYC